MTDEVSHRRIFLALWPDGATRKQLRNIQKSFNCSKLASAKAVSSDNFHITLHFLGNVSEEVINQLSTSLNSVKTKPFALTLDRWGYLPKSQVLWLGPGHSPDELAELVLATQSCVQSCLVDYSQKRFIPHATLYRHAPHPGRLKKFNAVSWKVDRFVLVESITWQEGAEYRVLQEWLLTV